MVEGRRKLAAILFTDIVGYSAISHRDEKHALELLEEHRVLVRPFFGQHHGREIKTIGDAFLVEFDSVLEAVECAMAIQRGLSARNAMRAREDRVLLRISVHLGDIVVDPSGDVHGDGVNTAARLLHYANAGGIAVSRQVYDQVHNKIDERLVEVGRRRLKNISRPIRIYRVALDASVALATHLHWRELRKFLLQGAAVAAGAFVAWYLVTNVRGGSAARESSALRVAVMPFDNLTEPRDEGEFLSDGITEEVISDLARLEHIRVMARSTVMRFKGLKKTPREIGAELGVGTLLEGVLKRDGTRVRVNVQLTDAESQETIWSQQFEGDLKDTFGIQRKIGEGIAKRFFERAPAGVRATMPESKEGGAPAFTPGQDAYLAYLKGRFLLNRRTEDGIRQGIAQLKEAVRLEPAFAAAYASMANGMGLLGYYGYVSPMSVLNETRPFIDRALELDPRSAEAWLALAGRQSYYEHDWAAAEASYRKATEFEPGHATAHQWFGEFLAARGRFDEARQELATALELDPLSLVTNVAAGLPEYYGRRYAKAEKAYRRVVEMDPAFVLGRLWLGRTLTRLGKHDEAIAQLKKAVELSKDSALVRAQLGYAYAAAGKKAQAKAILDGLRGRGESGYVACYGVAALQAGLGDASGMFATLRECVAERSYYLANFKVDPVFDPYRSDARYASIASRLSLE